MKKEKKKLFEFCQATEIKSDISPLFRKSLKILSVVICDQHLLSPDFVWKGLGFIVSHLAGPKTTRSCIVVVGKKQSSYINDYF